MKKHGAKILLIFQTAKNHAFFLLMSKICRIFAPKISKHYGTNQRTIAANREHARA